MQNDSEQICNGNQVGNFSENGLLDQPGNRVQNIWSKIKHCCSIPGPRHIGAAKELGFIDIIKRIL